MKSVVVVSTIQQMCKYRRNGRTIGVIYPCIETFFTCSMDLAIEWHHSSFTAWCTVEYRLNDKKGNVYAWPGLHALVLLRVCDHYTDRPT